jgi:histidinol-phosphate aminotransferase
LGLAGLRFGVAIGRPEWTNEIDKVRPPYNVNVLTQTAVAFALEHYDILLAQAASIVTERAKLQAALGNLGVEHFDSAANFVLIRLKNAQQTYDELKSRGILVRSFIGSHPLLAQTLRVNVSSPEENQSFLNAMRQILV